MDAPSLSIVLIVAAAENNAIGKGNQMPWHLPNDFKFFKNTTWGMPVVMGRKTFESMGKPLAGRTNIVITRQLDWNPEGVVVVHSLPEALQAAEKLSVKKVFIVGGGDLYRQTLPLADTVFLTRVHTHIDGDTFFPELSEADWQLDWEISFPADAKHAFAYQFQEWTRKKQPAYV
jgi:dihydrofolate reductase